MYAVVVVAIMLFAGKLDTLMRIALIGSSLFAHPSLSYLGNLLDGHNDLISRHVGDGGGGARWPPLGSARNNGSPRDRLAC